MPLPGSELIVFTLSDSSGETAEAVAKAALVQFPADQTRIFRLPQIRSCEQITQLVSGLATNNSIIAYTLVLPEYRQTLEDEAAKLRIPTVDLLSPLISRVALLTGATPLSQPGRLHLLDETYFQRIEAVDFAIRFDDGKNPDGILQADVILLGVSRTSKTPNCMYLAHHYGLKAANIPIVMDVEPPLQLFQVNAKKIIGFTIDPYLLQNIRTNRAQSLGISTKSGYADPEKICQEVNYSKSIFRDLQCHVIDVSAKAIEETSSEIYIYMRQ